jgi:MraZ protein
MFRGITNLSVDTKGRLAIPSRYRHSIIDASNGQIIVTVDHTDYCLLIYPMQDWLNVEEQLMKLSNMNRRSRNVQRLLLGHASECELDNQGRIRIAAPLREYAGLDKKVVLVGQLNKFELWDADTWQTERDAWITEAQSDDMEIDDALSQVSI